jgi:hypothetical protein
MGLDLYHYKATLKAADPSEASTFREDELDAHALDVLNFRRFIQVIPDFDFPTRIVIVPDEASRARLVAEKNWVFRDAFAVLVGNPTDFQAETERIERDHGLNPADRGITLDSTWIGANGSSTTWCQRPADLAQCRWGEPTPKPPQRRPNGSFAHQYVILDYRVPTSFRGLYVEEVGYQRKLVSREFYKLHRPLNPSARFADVRHTAFFVQWDPEPGWVQDARQRFIDQFIVPFEPGRSLILASF